MLQLCLKILSMLSLTVLGAGTWEIINWNVVSQLVWLSLLPCCKRRAKGRLSLWWSCWVLPGLGFWN